MFYIRVLKKIFQLYLLVVQFFRLSRFEELQQVPQSALIIVSERIPWTVPVPGHQPPGRGGGQWRVGVEKDTGETKWREWRGKRQSRGGRGRMSIGEVQRQELKENNKKGGGGQVMQHFYKQLQTGLKNRFTMQTSDILKIWINNLLFQVNRNRFAKIYCMTAFFHHKYSLILIVYGCINVM